MTCFVSLVSGGFGVVFAERPMVFVTTTAGAGDGINGLVWHLREQVHQSNQLASRDPAGLLDGAADQSLTSATRLLRRGIAAFSAFELDEAASKLEQASLVLAGWKSHHEQAVQALSLLGQTYAALGETARRDRVWRSLLTLRPDYRIRDSSVSPSTRKSLKQAHLDVRRAARNGRIQVRRTRRMPTAVFLNGRFMGMAPLKLEGLSRVTHHVRLSSDGFKHENAFIDLSHRRRAKLTYTGASTARRQLYAQIHRQLPRRVFGAEFEGFLRELKALVVSDQAILVNRHDGHYEAALFDLNRERRASHIRIPIGTTTARAAAISVFRGLYDRIDLVAPTAPRAQTVLPQRDAADGTDTNWWLWGGLTAGLVAAIVIPIAVWPDSSSGLDRKSGTGAIIFRY
ncbi:MAG: PEGA domain-containing protein [Myxococcota bacterium]|nr:PEGA domain-containing protein [Myxococcota bacterium]